MNHYTVGDVVHATAVFSDPVTREVLVPADVEAKWIDPNGSVTTSTPYSEGDAFAVDINTDGGVPGIWTYRFWSATPTQGAREGQFYLDASNFP